MPERFKVVCIPCKDLFKRSALPFTALTTKQLPVHVTKLKHIFSNSELITHDGHISEIYSFCLLGIVPILNTVKLVYFTSINFFSI